MWNFQNSFSIYDDQTGDEIYIELGTDKIVRVYHDAKVRAAFTQMSDAQAYLEKFVVPQEEFNGVQRENP